MKSATLQIKTGNFRLRHRYIKYFTSRRDVIRMHGEEASIGAARRTVKRCIVTCEKLNKKYLIKTSNFDA